MVQPVTPLASSSLRLDFENAVKGRSATRSFLPVTIPAGERLMTPKIYGPERGSASRSSRVAADRATMLARLVLYLSAGIVHMLSSISDHRALVASSRR